MKRYILLICTLLACCLCLTVLAEDNGLTGPLGEAVKQSGRWDGYRCLVPQAGNAAVMQGQGCNVLLLFTDGKLRSSFTAVYQPEDGRDGDLSLQWTDEGLILSYGQQEQFCFDTQNPTPWLKSAKLSGVECILTEVPYTDWVGRYLTFVHDDGHLTIFDAESFSSFHIQLFPRNREEVLRYNLMESMLFPLKSEKEPAVIIGTGDAPVFSAPYAGSQSETEYGISSGTDVLLHFTIEPENEPGYAFISFETEPSVQRFCYVPLERLKHTAHHPQEYFDYRAVCTVQDTWLTSEPKKPQSSCLFLPKGTKLTIMGEWTGSYAYASYEQPDGTVTDGFVPIIHLIPDPEVHTLRPDLMKELVGYWVFQAGGGSHKCLVFNEDGTYYDNHDFCDFRITEKTEYGCWYITDSYNGQNNVQELVFVEENGITSTHTLSIRRWNGRKVFSVRQGEGSAGYAAVDPSEIKDGFFTGDVWTLPGD